MIDTKRFKGFPMPQISQNLRIACPKMPLNENFGENVLQNQDWNAGCPTPTVTQFQRVSA
jgi:hypothetical protein